MKAFAEAQFALNAPEGDPKLGTTRRDVLQSLAEQGDPESAAELAALPGLPRLAAHLWTHFLTLSQTRTSNGFGVSRLTRAEIRLWQEDEGVLLDQWERRAIIELDGLYVASVSAQQAAATPGK